MLNDYTSVTAESITRIAEAAIAAADALIDAAVAVAGPRTFDNTMAPLERAGTIMSEAYGKSPFMSRVHPDATVRDRAVELEERIAKWGTDLIFRPDLDAAIREYSSTADAAGLTGTKARLVEFWLRDLRRAGHELNGDDQAELKRLQQRLIELQVAFSRNLDEWDDGIDLTRDDLAGLSDDYIDRLDAGDAAGTFKVSMAYPDYIPFMQEATRRDLRRQLQFKFWNRASKENHPLLAEAVEIRRRMAALFGLSTWAHFAMETQMAKGPEAVSAFYESIAPRLAEKARTEIAVLEKLLHRDDPTPGSLQSWDSAFYTEQLRKQRYGVDQNEIARYFPLEQVVDGMFDITGEVFGLDYRRIEDARAWHEDVHLYEIRDRGADEPLAYFYADLFPREGKFGHAAAFPIIYGQELPDGSYRKPVAAIVANFTKPTGNSPSLLKHDEALTLFHEFGHVLHFCLTTVDLLHFAGYDTERDFVEAPSQIMEHWMWQPEVLQRFARHYETGDPIPAELVEKLVAARDLNIGLSTVRQIFLGKLDLALHAVTGPVDVDEAYRRSYESTLLPFYEGTDFPSSFGHLMGGYDAGYYGYLWSKVYGDDMFSVFEAAGILSREVGKRYRDEVLARGHSRDAIEHLRAFLGREPNSDAFLRNLGLGS